MLDLSCERHGAAYSNPVDAEHWHRYILAQQLAKGNVVLDIACGEGYGSALLAGIADHVYGVDADIDVIKHAKDKYRYNNLTFLNGSLSNIPLEMNSISLITCFETIEHVVEHDLALGEFKRVMNEKGVLLISTPDRMEYSIKRNYNNPYHVKELSKDELINLLRNFFPYVALYAQRFFCVSFIDAYSTKDSIEEIHQFEGAGIISKRPQDEPMYWIAAASNSPLPVLKGSFFDITSNWMTAMENDRKRIYGSWSYKIGNKIVRMMNVFRGKQHG